MATPVDLTRISRIPVLTGPRIVFALAVAIAADGLQFITGPFGWAGLDQIIDVVAMLLTAWALGFHLLLLPTFILELVPGLDDLPTWTACVIAVIVLRRKAQRRQTEIVAIGQPAAPPVLTREIERP